MKPVAPAKPLPNAGLLNNAFEHPAGRVGLSTDVQGADPKVLEKFNQSLPKGKAVPSKPVARKLPWEDEIMAERDQVVADSQQWEVAQAEVSGAAGGGSGAAAAGGAEAGAAAGGAGAGGAGAGAAGAGAGGAAGAAGAVAGVSPLAFAPALALGGGGSFVNTAPVLKLPTEARLPINAASGPVACAKAVGSDVDTFQTLNYYFLDSNGKRVSELPAMSSGTAGGEPVQVGTYTIDRLTGQISFTANGTDAHICDSDVLKVVAYDGVEQSLPHSITIERSLVVDKDILIGAETPEMSSLTSHLNFDGYTEFRDLVVNTDPEFREIDLLDITWLSGWADEDAVEPTELKEFSAYRVGTELHIELEHCSPIHGGGANHYGYEIHVEGQFADAGQGVEFIHFEKGTTFAGYDLGQSPLDDDTYVPCDGDPLFFQEHGVYRVSSAAATANGDALNGTNCKDLIVGSEEFEEQINGGAGNDLLFAKSEDHCPPTGGDTVRGGSGDDLIVLQGEGHTVVLETTAAANGVDTVVGFDHHSAVKIGDALVDINWDALGLVPASPLSLLDGAFSLEVNGCDLELFAGFGESKLLMARFVDSAVLPA